MWRLEYLSDGLPTVRTYSTIGPKANPDPGRKHCHMTHGTMVHLWGPFTSNLPPSVE